MAADFEFSFPPYSMTLFTLTPEPPRLEVLAPVAPSDQVTLRLHGQPGVRYVIQSATDLINWLSISTNGLITSTLDLTYSVDQHPQYWRALWKP
jgi:hypothetical protein